MNKHYKISTLLLLFLFSFNLSFAQCPNLVWSDEFSGDTLNTDNWTYQIGDGCDIGICGWGNNELQSYQRNNLTVENGLLKITARRQFIDGKEYSSSRINSKGKQDFTYGRFEARIKLPEGGGLWPAFWMLSTPEPYGGWPQSGEIDIMEFVGNDPEKTLGVIHYGNLFPNNQNQGTSFELFNDQKFFEEYHVFAVEWQENEIKWFVDGNLFQIKTNNDIAPFNWPFDHDFHFLLNVAVGGNLGGQVDNTIFPTTMEVDYVRVYDGFRPYITGNRFVENAATGVTYNIGNVAEGTNVTWSVPAEAMIMSGQGSPSITVDWGASTGGDVTAFVTTACGVDTLAMNVGIAPAYIRDFSFENFDDFSSITTTQVDGTLNEVDNPAPNDVNNSARVGQYTRNSSVQFDVIAYNISAVPTNAGPYVNGEKRFYVDVYTDAPIGTEIILQLESSSAGADNFPAGRHSRYFAQVEQNNVWHRVFFEFGDRPDGSVPDGSISTMIILFASNTSNGDTYYYDNLDSYAIEGSLVTSLDPFEEENSFIELNSFPNPFVDQFNLNVHLEKRGSISTNIYNKEGQVLNTIQLDNLERGDHIIPINLSNTPAGLYLIQVQMEGRMKTIKLLKE